METLIDRLIYWTNRNPNKPAIIHNKIVITYQEFLNQVLHLAEQFTYADWVGKRLAIILPNSPELAAIYYAAFRAGIVLVPINVLWKADQISRIAATTAPDAVIMHSSALVEIPQLQINSKNCYISGDRISTNYLYFDDFIASAQRSSVKEIDPSQLAMIFSTSGSTGNPKFIMHSNQTLLEMADNMADACDLTEKDKFLISESMTNASGTTHLTLTLSHGGTAILMEGLPMDLLKIILNKNKPSIICVMGKGNLDIIHSTELSKADFNPVHRNFTGGDKITKELINQFQQKTGVEMRVGYGMSECLAIAVNRSHDVNKQGSVGKPTKNLLLEIHDNNGKKVKTGNIGEVWVKGKNVMLGYWQNTEATNQTLVDGWLHTGDLGYQDDEGYLWIVGRLKNIIIRDGENISPYQIEEILATHPAVKIAGVIGVEDKEEGQVPYAFIELKQPCDIEKIINYLKTKLDYLSIPKYVKIVGALPRTANGKIDREKLRSLLVE